jgi:hypothetical protein
MLTRRSLAAIALALVLPACGKDKGERPRAEPQGSSAPPPVAKVAEVSGLPADTRVLLEARVGPLAASPVVRPIVERVLARDPGASARLEALLRRCKIDLVRDVERLTIAMREPTEVALIVIGRLDEAAVTACVAAETGGLTTTQKQGLTVHAAGAAESRVWLTFAAGALVASSSERWLETLLDATGPKLAARPDLYARVDRSRALWGAGTMPPGVGTRLTELTRGAVKQPARAVSFTVDASGPALAAALRLEMQDEADARELAAFTRGQVDLLAIAAQRFGLGRLVARTQINAEGAGVTLALRVDEQDVRLLEGALVQETETKEQVR